MVITDNTLTSFTVAAISKHRMRSITGQIVAKCQRPHQMVDEINKEKPFNLPFQNWVIQKACINIAAYYIQFDLIWLKPT